MVFAFEPDATGYVSCSAWYAGGATSLKLSPVWNTTVDGVGVSRCVDAVGVAEWSIDMGDCSGVSYVSGMPGDSMVNGWT